ncbi:hypothetical protein ACFX2C_003204 [Malus domestica]
MTHDLNNLSLASLYPQHDTDKATRRILFKGLYNNRLYPIPYLTAFSSAPVFSANQVIACFGKLVTSTLWHSRLGHPSNPIVSHILHKSKVSVVKDTSPIVCQSCLEGKFQNFLFNQC